MRQATSKVHIIFMCPCHTAHKSCLCAKDSLGVYFLEVANPKVEVKLPPHSLANTLVRYKRSSNRLYHPLRLMTLFREAVTFRLMTLVLRESGYLRARLNAANSDKQIFERAIRCIGNTRIVLPIETVVAPDQDGFFSSMSCTF